ncbi:MAG: hypothetical protein JW709_06695, partial [Sedimentisphaerales bacterium]|nr:hypothetical protein [Sedimentisphaerales bacterium]
MWAYGPGCGRDWTFIPGFLSGAEVADGCWCLVMHWVFDPGLSSGAELSRELELTMKIVVLDGFTLNPGDNPWAPVEAFGEVVVYDRTPGDKIIERALPADIILTNKTPLMADTLAQLPNLKFISVLATGFNVVDVKAARGRNISV